MTETLLLTRYHIAGFVLSGCAISISTAHCGREEPRTGHDCQSHVIEPFLHRKPDDVTLGELRLFVGQLQECASRDPLFVEHTDLFGIGAYTGDDAGAASIHRAAPFAP